MKKTLLLTMALGLAGASSLMAGTVDVYITGSTAFRANVFTACEKLFSPNQTTGTVYYADSPHGGASSFTTKAASWVMTGTPITQLTNLSGNTLVIHGLFTGSVQGIQTVLSSTKLTWAQPTGTPGGTATTYVTNSPTIGFSDADNASTPYTLPSGGNYAQEIACVQPFIMVKSTQGGVMTNINNVSWEQLVYGIPQGRIPLSSWTGHSADTNTFIYLMERTADSGTRRTFTASAYYEFNDPCGIYLYDPTNDIMYTPTATNNFALAYGSSPNGVIGSEGPGNGNANLNWGFGYIGGGDIANSLDRNGGTHNLAIACLSIADGKSVPATTNWGYTVSYNGFWPTAAGAGIANNTGTNDFSPITLGYYSLWGFEVFVFPINPGTVPTADQDITKTELGDNLHPGSFLGVFNNQSTISGTLLTGSIENEIKLSEPGGATAVTLAEMGNTRANVGEIITPPVQ